MLAEQNPWVLRTICTMVAALIVIACILWNIRQRRLRETYAIIWLVFGVALLLFGVFPQIFMYISTWTGIYYLTLIMGFFFICLFVFILQISVIISSHSDSVCRLTQRSAIAREEIESLKQQVRTLQDKLDTGESQKSGDDNQNGGDA
ncbi:MAG: DUF2304 domain-containing protein [Phycisphaerae bacterium]|nr:DUF2304 domain-containing protein [Phycisphaerae bacterium]